jgi:hypothetical protein
MPRQLLVGDRLPEELEDFGERLIQVDLLRLVEAPRPPGEDEAQDGVVGHARDVVGLGVHRRSSRRYSSLLGVYLNGLA